MTTLDAKHIRHAAQNQWHGILESAGLDSRLLTKKHGACPVCGGKDRFRFDDKDGRGTFICNQCGAGDGFRLLQLHLGSDFKDALKFVARWLGIDRTDYACISPKKPIILPADKTNSKQNQARIADIWRNSIDDHPRLKDYLQKRGCMPAQLPSDVKLHPSLEYWHDGAVIGHFPAMTALVKDSRGKVKGLHRTYLSATRRGEKADVPTAKKLISLHDGSTSGCCIQLYPIDDSGILAVAEGIETALAVRCALPHYQVWATVSAGNMSKMQLPEGLKTLLIFGDLDRSNTGENAAHELARRATAAGIKTRVMMPTERDARRVYAAHGTLGKSIDWLDVWNCAAIAVLEGETA